MSLATFEPGLISVVIPTYHRHIGLRQATLSVVRQTYPHVEVIVISDGPDPEARAAVRDLGQRVRYVELAANAGPAAARNYGIQQSRGEWISFLDDDDLMLPHRLERQAADLDPAMPHVMSACRLIYRRQGGSDAAAEVDIWPARPIAPGEDLGDYLLLRPSLLGRPGVVSLQSLLVHHTLAREVLMPTLPEHEDWAWLLDVWHQAGGRIHFFWEPLVVYQLDISGRSRSGRRNWADSLSFALRFRQQLSPRAFNSFLSSKVMLKARRAGDWRAIHSVFSLLWGNHATARDYLYFFGICLLPLGLAQRLWKRSLRRAPLPFLHRG